MWLIKYISPEDVTACSQPSGNEPSGSTVVSFACVAAVKRKANRKLYISHMVQVQQKIREKNMLFAGILKDICLSPQFYFMVVSIRLDKNECARRRCELCV